MPPLQYCSQLIAAVAELSFVVTIGELPFIVMLVGYGIEPRAWMVWTISPLWLAFLVIAHARCRRQFGAHDPFARKDWPRSRLLRGAVFLLDEADKRFFGRQKSGGWA